MGYAATPFYSNNDGAPSHAIEGGDSETRPKNLYVHDIIKL
jgi:hypothetical protein